MEFKNGIIIDGVLYELAPAKSNRCINCALLKMCEDNFGLDCLCWVGLESQSLNKELQNKKCDAPIFYNRGKVKIIKDKLK